MVTIKSAEPVKLIMGIISKSNELTDAAMVMLKQRWGELDNVSQDIRFSFTDYYGAEMGSGLSRLWVSFDKLINPGELAKIKIETNRIEDGFALSGKRRINIDPGYIALSKVVLASTKDFSHRIYLQDGIFAEITLLYKDKRFTALPWSYPDYQSEAATAFLLSARERYHSQITNI